MKDRDKSKEHLIDELAELRQRVAELEAAEAERERAEEALRESERRFRDLFEGVPACCWAFDREGTVLYWNRACEQLYGWTAEQAVGKTMFELMVKDENVAPTRETIAVVFQGQSFYGLEYEDRKADGTTCNVLASEYPLKDASDQVVMGICAELDITERKGVEQALRESEEKFRNLAEQSPNMIFINKAGKIVYANKRCEEVMGHTRDEFYAEDFNFFTLIALDHRELVRANFGQHRVGRQIEPHRYALVTKDCRRVEVIITTRLIDYEGEKAILGTVTDITEHKRAEEEIQRRALEQETLREAALALTTTLDRGEVIDRILAQLREVVPYDTASVQLLRENRLEIVGGRGFPNLEELLGVTFDPSREDNPNREVIRTRASFIVEDAPTMYGGFLRDPHAAAGIRSWLGVPMVMGEQLIGMFALDKSEPGFYTQEHARLAEAFAAQAAIAIENARLHQEVLDYAEQLEQRVQERTTELQAQYARLDAILNSTTDGIVVADTEGGIIQTNPVAQAWLTETFPSENAERLRDTVQKLARQAGKLPEVVLELTELDLELRASSVTEEGAEEPSAAVVDIHDVSHLKTLDRMKTIFVANVSHELRQPVSTIKSYAYLMQKTPPTDERWTEYLNSLVREADRQTELVEDIMQISRIQAGRLSVDSHPTPLNELSQAAVIGYRALAQERGLALEHHLLEPGPVASVDPKQMAQVLNILMDDAIRYTPEGGRVVISTGTEKAEEPAWATVTVSDTGKGILVEDLPYVFERFFREEEPRSVRAAETGLRLMIVKGIVELHGGRVAVESEGGLGSAFTIRLPLVDCKGARNPQAQDLRLVARFPP
jgi:two-component system phosphate regulon sensor histidine kinase PhoR